MSDSIIAVREIRNSSDVVELCAFTYRVDLGSRTVEFTVTVPHDDANDCVTEANAKAAAIKASLMAEESAPSFTSTSVPSLVGEVTL